MKKWVSTLGQKASRLVRYLLQPVPSHGNGHGTIAHLPISTESRQSNENRPLKNELLFIPQGLKTTSCLNASYSNDYLLNRKNYSHDIKKLDTILRMPHVLLEIGCGDGEAARQIALNNPGIGIIATDLYDWSKHQHLDSHYRHIALKWRAGQLPAQSNTLANIVVLRAEADLLCCLPCRTIDTIFLLNPEPRVGKSFLELFKNKSLSKRMKIGPEQIIILPYSRELGVASCGGCSFEHERDWSKGLGFLMESGFSFKLGASVYWGMDLSTISAYSGNSTQAGIFVYGERTS